MRRAFALTVVAIAVLATSTSVHAQEETPSGTFSSPTRAVAGAPIWVRSISPCPVTPGAYQFVRVGISEQSMPSITYLESTDADLDSDGSWLVTLSAPADMPKGITKSYEIQAQCIEHTAPYLAPSSSDEAEAPAAPADPLVSYKRYFYRRLYVTGFGGATATNPGAATATSTTTTSTTAPTTTTTTTASLSSSALVLSAAGLDRMTTTTTWISDEAERAAEARAELAKRSDAGDDRTLAAETVVATTRRPQPDAGIPWWSFVLATMLAVGAVVGYGQRRRSSPVE